MPTKKRIKKKIYVLDTSTILSCNDVFLRFKNNDICIPFTTLSELDKIKIHLSTSGYTARSVIRTLENLMSKGSLQENNGGVRIAPRKSKIFAKGGDLDLLPDDLDPKIMDNQILSVCLLLKKERPNTTIILMSQDINLRILGQSIGINSKKLEIEAAISKKKDIYDGWGTIIVDNEHIDQFYESELILERDTIKKTLYKNQFLTLTSIADSKKTAIARFIDWDKPLKKIKAYKKRQNVQGIQPRNKEQAAALDLLMDHENINLVSLIGLAGSGKSLLACAAGLELTSESNGREPIYDRFLICRPIHSVGNQDVGYLPGNLDEKLSPMLGSIKDSLQFLIGDKMAFDNMVISGRLELAALAHIRGRSLPKSFILIEESQNLTIHEVRTILTRVGSESLIVLCGDLDQIDNPKITTLTSGLTHVVEKFKNESIAGNVLLKSGVRSKLATLASKIL